MPQSALAVVALGSNLGDSALIIDQAMERLQSLTESTVLRSKILRTVPVDCPPGSPDFVNAVAAFQPAPDETPETLLDKLLDLEREFGPRPRIVVNAPRHLDLDLIAFRDEIRMTNKLTLPHPRAHLRRFVLEPLSEILPGLVLPGQRESVARLLKNLERSTSP